jgi:hypothetical protein
MHYPITRPFVLPLGSLTGHCARGLFLIDGELEIRIQNPGLSGNACL